DYRIDADALMHKLRSTTLETVMVDAGEIAERLLGDKIGANMLLVGASWQQGGLPLSYEALMHAITLNGVAIEKNKQAFELGRLAYAEPETVSRLMQPTPPVLLDAHRPQTAAEVIADRLERLQAYGGASYVARYRAMIDQPGFDTLSPEAQLALAKGAYKLLAVKDEWEVARLYARPEFLTELEAAFEGDLKLQFHIGAWPFAKRDKTTGKLGKAALGPWLLPALRLMSRMRGLRGSWLDPFRYGQEAQLHRKALAIYEADVSFALTQAAAGADPQVLAELLNLPEQIRGYGHVRERHLEKVQTRRAELRTALTQPSTVAAE
ncbi:MAG: DUF6537 domain-containing protein, partial [Pseudomonadota bacterium]|nr:DUF6537 domain-containing protein [Pseudomonadota bacterium]